MSIFPPDFHGFGACGNGSSCCFHAFASRISIQSSFPASVFFQYNNKRLRHKKPVLTKYKFRQGSRPVPQRLFHSGRLLNSADCSLFGPMDNSWRCLIIPEAASKFITHYLILVSKHGVKFHSIKTTRIVILK